MAIIHYSTQKNRFPQRYFLKGQKPHNSLIKFIFHRKTATLWIYRENYIIIYSYFCSGENYYLKI